MAGRSPPAPVELRDPAERATWATCLSAPDVTGIPTATWTILAARLEPTYQRLREQETAQARNGRTSAYPDRRERGLKVPIVALMLAAVLHERHRLPVAQVSRLIDLNPVSLKQHITRLVPLFAAHGQPLTSTGNKIKKLEQLHTTIAIPQETPATRDVTT